MTSKGLQADVAGDALMAVAENLESAHLDLVDKAVAVGMSEQEVAIGLLWCCLLHIELLKGRATELVDLRSLLQSIIAN